MTGSILTKNKTHSGKLKEIPIIGMNCFIEEEEGDWLKAEVASWHKTLFPNVMIPHDFFNDKIFGLRGSDPNTIKNNSDRLSVHLYDIDFKTKKIEYMNVLYGESEEDENVGGQGIYFCLRLMPAIYSQGAFAHEVAYIGQTTKGIKERFRSHVKTPALKLLRAETVVFISYPEEFFSKEQINWAERQYIKLLSPLLNDKETSELAANGE
jgi:hypothetical protein